MMSSIVAPQSSSRLAHEIQIVNVLILDHELDEQVRDTLGLPLRLLVPVIVGGVLLDKAIRESQEVGHRNKLRDRRGARRRWIARNDPPRYP
ncbi:hypothetical protein [Bradyrhizobium sp. 192]|uniref:hypothetical protein n=1 Tax=Bradyrhizobium sp. 192 TaxID=2782660 RepID=UPI001FFF3E86|nr:hypothetical protein [Bradyrhizobium sp. 192]UPJ60679.1 hypothetical protein IVB24_14180 [Bradyrhizobium sp. 192]